MANMETINSNDNKLPSADIIVKTLQQLGSKQIPPATALAIIVKESSLETADSIQIGNTVFLGHRGGDANSNKMVGRAFNVDTGKNYIRNTLEYIEYLRKKGVTHYTTMFEGSEVLKMIQFIQRAVKNIDTNIYIGKRKSGSYIAYVKFGTDSIPKVF
jgi:hypothetical protein|tara:strand:+ start:106 stop:579 length:474 start_codon:yes stop_codon:yes gene_type:complete